MGLCRSGATQYTCCHSLKANRLFAHCHSQKPIRFPAEQNVCVYYAAHSFCPPAVAAGITHYTFVPKVVCQRVPLWKPSALQECSHTSHSCSCSPSSKAEKSEIISATYSADIISLLMTLLQCKRVTFTIPILGKSQI